MNLPNSNIPKVNRQVVRLWHISMQLIETAPDCRPCYYFPLRSPLLSALLRFSLLRRVHSTGGLLIAAVCAAFERGEFGRAYCCTPTYASQGSFPYSDLSLSLSLSLALSLFPSLPDSMVVSLLLISVHFASRLDGCSLTHLSATFFLSTVDSMKSLKGDA